MLYEIDNNSFDKVAKINKIDTKAKIYTYFGNHSLPENDMSQLKIAQKNIFISVNLSFCDNYNNNTHYVGIMYSTYYLPNYAFHLLSE